MNVGSAPTWHFGIDFATDRCVRPLGKPRSRPSPEGIFRFWAKIGGSRERTRRRFATSKMTTPHSIPTTQADASASLASPEVLRTKDDAAAPPVSTDALLKGPRGVDAAGAFEQRISADWWRRSVVLGPEDLW